MYNALSVSSTDLIGSNQVLKACPECCLYKRQAAHTDWAVLFINSVEIILFSNRFLTNNGLKSLFWGSKYVNKFL
jgi:hypothetical protein